MRRPSSPAMRWTTTGAIGRRTAMKRPTPESVSVTPAIRKPRIATAARRPAPPRLSARSAEANTARWRHTASLPKKAEAQYLKSAATCTEKAIYYKSCAVCGLSSEGTADEATFFSGNALDHDWSAWTSNEDGTHTRTCTVDGCSAGTQTENCIDANKDHKCDICDYIISECADDNKDHKCDYCGKKLTEHTGGKATCKDKAKCEVCGAEYGELDAKNHTNLKHFPAKTATKTTEGNIEYWYCEGCGKYFSDKGGTKEIKKADTVTAKLKDDSKSPQTGDTSNLAFVDLSAVCQRLCSNWNNGSKQKEKA